MDLMEQLRRIFRVYSAPSARMNAMYSTKCWVGTKHTVVTWWEDSESGIGRGRQRPRPTGDARCIVRYAFSGLTRTFPFGEVTPFGRLSRYEDGGLRLEFLVEEAGPLTMRVEDSCIVKDMVIRRMHELHTVAETPLSGAALSGVAIAA